METLPAVPGEAKVLHTHQPTQPWSVHLWLSVQAQSETPTLVLGVELMSL